jgi:hypothetical protein
VLTRYVGTMTKLSIRPILIVPVIAAVYEVLIAIVLS